MKKYNYVGKTRSEALNLALYELNSNEEDLIIKESEQKGGLFKSKKIELEIIKKEDIVNQLKELLINICNKIGVEINIETTQRGGYYNLTIFSDNNAILIGKDGRTISALNLISKQALQNELGFNFKYNLDVAQYKAKQEGHLVREAKKIAREVGKTKIDATLDPMNSYERRIVHNALTNNKYVYTESIGEEPNRQIVIKAKEKKKED